MATKTEQELLDEVTRDFEGTAYRLVKPLAHGGMGSVFVAQHVKLDRAVVVKILLPALSKEPQIIERLVLEGRVLANVEHPNLVKVNDLSVTPGGRAFIVMELLTGTTLRELLAERKVVPPIEAIDLVTQVLAGLDAAHRAQVVHRDVKLDNIFVCSADERGRRVVKLLDFGIAKVLSAGLRGDAKFPTAEGTIMGTPMFMSPEQAMAKAVDARSDIYSTGIVLFRAVAGRQPFVPTPGLDRDRAFLELFKMQVEQRPPVPSAIAPQSIPPELDAVIIKALEKQPADRYLTARAFAEDLERVRAEIERSIARGLRTSAARTEVIERALSSPGVAERAAPPAPRAPEPAPPTISDAATLPRRWEQPVIRSPRRGPAPIVYALIALASAVVFTFVLRALVAWLRAG